MNWGSLQDGGGKLGRPTASKEGLRAVHRLYRAERSFGRVCVHQACNPDLFFSISRKAKNRSSADRSTNSGSGSRNHGIEKILFASLASPEVFQYLRATGAVNDFWFGTVATESYGANRAWRSIFNLRVRDQKIEKLKCLRSAKSFPVNIMDAYVLGAVPPYNQLLGGKLLLV